MKKENKIKLEDWEKRFKKEFEKYGFLTQGRMHQFIKREIEIIKRSQQKK